jgi:type I restriction enzyme S subunit
MADLSINDAQSEQTVQTTESLITQNIDIWTTAIKQKSSAGRGTASATGKRAKFSLYGIKKLRELILELAVRGKLVPQASFDERNSPDYEPASVLLERIAAEKAQLVKDKKIKKQKPLPAIEDGEKLFELPQGWSHIRLDDICFGVTSGSTPPQDKFQDSPGVPYLKVYNIKNQKIDFHHKPQFVESNYHVNKLTRSVLYPGDVVMNIVGPPLGKIAIIPEEFPEWNCNQAIVFFRPIQLELNQYIYTYLTAGLFLKSIELIGTAGQDNISVTKSRSIVIPIPPLEEQHRIVAKVDELMSLCDALEAQTEASIAAHQTLVETLLKSLIADTSGKTTMDGGNVENAGAIFDRVAEHFDTLFTTEASIDSLKQTILQLAVMGKLVEQASCEARNSPNYEPAAKLLERIAKEKAQLIKDGKIKKQKPLPAITAEEKPFELPHGWEWTRFGAYIEINSGNSFTKVEELNEGQYIYCKVGDMNLQGNETFITTSNSFINPNDKQLKSLIRSGSIIFPKRGGAIATNKKRYVNQEIFADSNVMAVKPLAGTSVEYVMLWLSSFDLASLNTGTSVPQINNKDIEPLIFTLPPLEEQYRIVAKVDELMGLCDQLKARLSDAQTTQLHLTDAIVEQAV